jgi:hypothetical protein
LGEDRVGRGEQGRGCCGGAAALEAEFAHRPSRECPDSFDVAPALLAAQLAAATAGRTQGAEHVPAIGGGPQRSPDEGPEHPFDRRCCPDLGGELAVEEACLALVHVTGTKRQRAQQGAARCA